MKSSLEVLVKNLSNNDSKHLKLVQQKEVHAYKYTDSFLKNNYLIDLNFLVP